MKSISVTVGILILTVFLSLSAPAYAGTEYPYSVYGYVNYTNGTPADGELVTIYKAGYPSNNITAEVGSSYGVSGWWKADLYNIPGSVIHGEPIVFEVLGKPTTFAVNTSAGGLWVSDPATYNGGDDNGGDDNGGDDNGGSSGGSGGSGGTYPPGWGDPASTPAATPASTAAPEPTVAPAEAPTKAPTEAPTKAPTAAPTETTTTKMKTEGTPGFGAVLTVFAIAGLLVATYLVMRRRE